MKRFASVLLMFAMLAGCGADGFPETPTKPLKERLLDKKEARATSEQDAS